MVPKIAKKGASFKGASLYYLHDKGASSDERVEWTETRNLATNNPEAAWRVMAATAINADRLKRNAGIAPTGRKSNNAVMVYSLSWHPDEKEGLTREEMLKAANDSLEALGAGDHQVMMICHNDEPHPHVHIMVNRVSPKDGRMLPSSKEKLNLSKWAQSYEETRGKIWCEERVANNRKRELLQEFTRAAKDKPRHIFEEEARADQAAERRPKSANALKELERKKDAELSRYGRELQERHEQDWVVLSAEHKARKQAIDIETKRQVSDVKNAIRKRDMPKWDSITQRHKGEREKFDASEAKIIGRMKNTIQAIKSMAVTSTGNETTGHIAEAYSYIASSQKRAEQLGRIHNRELRLFKIKQNKEIGKNTRRIKQEGKGKQSQNLEYFYERRKDVKFKQSMENAALKAKWRQRNTDRKKSWESFKMRDAFLRKSGTADLSQTRAPKDFTR